MQEHIGNDKQKNEIEIHKIGVKHNGKEEILWK